MLLLSWRLPSHPKAGGAEHLTQRVAEGLARRGHIVHWAGAGAAPAREVSGVRYTDIGSQLSCIARAPKLYRSLAPRPDVVVEQINTLPFFASRYVDGPLLTWFQQLARNVWWFEAPFPLNAIGFALEPWYLRAYKYADVITISKSSADDLRHHDVGKRISIIPIAVDVPVVEHLGILPPSPLRLIFIGRLVPSKRPQDAIRALALVRQARAATLTILGRGPTHFVERLRCAISREGVADFVNLRGFVSDEEKAHLLDAAHLLIVPSTKEGWGLVATEANRRGVPAVAYNADGLRDAIIDGSTGWLCEPNPKSLAAKILEAAAAPALFEAVRENAWRWAQSFSWERTVTAFEEIVLRAVRAPGFSGG